MPVSYPISEIVVADTGVFWDIAYCPIPGGLGPEKNYQNIKLALKNMGYYGEKQTRVNKILHDLTFWGIRQKKEERRANVMLISGTKTGDKLYVKFLGYCEIVKYQYPLSTA